MRLLTVFLFIFAVAALPARAADNMIIIKNKDGSVTEYEIPEESRNRPVEVQRPEPQPQTRIQMKSEQKPQESVKQEAERPAEPEQPPAAEPEKAEAAPPEEAAPVEQGQLPPAEPAKAEAKKEPVKEAKKEKVAKGPSIPVPGRKPLLPQQVLETARSLPPDTAIPKSLAISIAIQHAPPARDFKVLREMHDGIPVYAVVFKTEDGPHTVMVDARNGEVVN